MMLVIRTCTGRIFAKQPPEKHPPDKHTPDKHTPDKQICGRYADKPHRNSGFSLIELLIVIAVLAILSSILVLTPKVFRQKELDKHTKALCNQIREMQTLSTTKAGKWRLAMYLKDGEYYCVQEQEEKDGGSSVWNERSGHTALGQGSAITYNKIGSQDEASDAPKFVWRFNKDTGACTQGAGTYEISGLGRLKHIKVYAQSGRCEEGELP